MTLLALAAEVQRMAERVDEIYACLQAWPGAQRDAANASLILTEWAEELRDCAHNPGPWNTR